VRALVLASALAWALAPAPQASAAAPPGAEECAGRAIAALQRRYESVRDLSARFEQTSRSVALGGPAATERSQGQVVFAKPGRMRWSYETPEPSLVVSDGKELWIYDPARQEAQRFPVTEGYLSGAAVQFLLGQGQILREFNAKALRCEATAVELELVPRAPATYEKLRVVTDPRSGELLETTVFDLVGNATTVALRDAKTNLDPKPSLFRFEAPEGVRVLELGAGAEGR
jgi:outer membrane lipoprotein carrier protein